MAHADSYSDLERAFIGPGRQLLAFVLSPVTRLLVWLAISPNMVSTGQLLMGIVFIIIAGSHPRLALAAFVIALLFDAMDGMLARRTGRASAFGALFDQLCDHARETMIIGGLVLINALNPLLAVFYVFTYGAFNLMLYLCNHYRAPIAAAVKSYLLLYPAIFVYLLSRENWLDVATVLSLIMMWIVIVVGLRHLSRWMS